MEKFGIDEEIVKVIIPEAYKEYMDMDDIIVLCHCHLIKNKTGFGEITVKFADKKIVDIRPTPYYKDKEK